MQRTEELEVTDTDAGAVVAVKAVPGARGERIAGVLGSRLKIAVAAAAEDGKANKAIAAVLARALGVPARRVRLVAGRTRPTKQFAATGMTAAEVRRRLEALQD